MAEGGRVGRKERIAAMLSEPEVHRSASDELTEVRRVDPKTGGEKGEKLAVLGDACPKALTELAKVYGHGRKKYARLNYLRGYDWSLSYDALDRHLKAFWGGDDIDDESGLHHLAHAAWHCLALLAFSIRGLGKDDRPTAANIQRYIDTGEL